MCGITGYVNANGDAVDRSTLDAMNRAIIHRGPDEDGFYVSKNVGLAMRRLSIIDLRTGDQPVTSEDKTVIAMVNGELYNFREVRADLEKRGHKFVTQTDVEIVPHLYQEYGRECVQKMRGMFAFAIWESGKSELFIARDRFGVKPLYYVHDENGDLYFASEIKAILAAGALKPEVNFDALSDYLANHGTSDDSTLFKDVKRLPPGHTLIWKDGRIEIERYWDLNFEPKLNGYERNTDDWGREWYELFRESVEMRLMADVPLGMFLSGGIDSSAIAAVMAQIVDDPIKTFSVAFEESEANELTYARLVADQFKTDHHVITLTPEEFFSELPKLIWHEDEPLAHPSSVALNCVSKLASQHVKVVLTGEGADELFGGYFWYHLDRTLAPFGVLPDCGARDEERSRPLSGGDVRLSLRECGGPAVTSAAPFIGCGSPRSN